MRVQCCVCKKVEENGTWRDAPSNGSTDTVSHTYCPACLHEAVMDIRAERTEAVLAAQRRLSPVAY